MVDYSNLRVKVMCWLGGIAVVVALICGLVFGIRKIHDGDAQYIGLVMQCPACSDFINIDPTNCSFDQSIQDFISNCITCNPPFASNWNVFNPCRSCVARRNATIASDLDPVHSVCASLITQYSSAFSSPTGTGAYTESTSTLTTTGVINDPTTATILIIIPVTIYKPLPTTVLSTTGSSSSFLTTTITTSSPSASAPPTLTTTMITIVPSSSASSTTISSSSATSTVETPSATAIPSTPSGLSTGSIIGIVFGIVSVIAGVSGAIFAYRQDRERGILAQVVTAAVQYLGTEIRSLGQSLITRKDSMQREPTPANQSPGMSPQSVPPVEMTPV